MASNYISRILNKRQDTKKSQIALKQATTIGEAKAALGKNILKVNSFDHKVIVSSLHFPGVSRLQTQGWEIISSGSKSVSLVKKLK